MDKVLSQEEINALFSAMSSDNLRLDSSAENLGREPNISQFDFHRADCISQDQLRSLSLLHEYFGRNFASSLSAYLRAFAEVNLASLEQLAYSEFVKSLPESTLFASVGMSPLDSNLGMELNPSLVFPMIDMILGGPGHAEVGDRNLTEIEMNIIEGVLKLAIRDLKAAWRPIIELDFFLDGKGAKAQMFQFIAPAETVVAIHFELKIGDNSGMMNICIPSRVLKMLRNKFDQQWNVRRQKISGSEAARIFELMKMVPISLRGEIHGSHLTVDDLLKVSAGDVIELNERIVDPVYLCVGGVTKFAGRIISRRGKRSFEIAEKLDE
jgi:flagellar motor switch protein FliM